MIPQSVGLADCYYKQILTVKEEKINIFSKKIILVKILVIRMSSKKEATAVASFFIFNFLRFVVALCEEEVKKR
jgi:hypothetical protein